MNSNFLKPELLLVLLYLIISCKEKTKVSVTTTQSPPPALSVEAVILKPRDLSADIEIPGTILAYESTEIHPEMAGRLVTLNVREGANVSKGALLAKLYDGDLQAQMRKLEVQLKIADQTEKRQAELLKIQGISQQEYDLSLLEVHKFRADMDIVRQSIRKTEIRAPFSGKLGLKNVSPGAYISPTDIITTISQVNRLKLQFSIPERYGSELKNGMTVTFKVDGSDKTFSANILATEVQVEENSRSLAVRAVVKENDSALIPGAFAKVKIVLGQNENALLIPNSAIIPIGRKKQIFLYKNGFAQPAEVVTGVRDSTNVQILEGVKEGDTVITSAILFLRPNSAVRIDTIK